MDTQKLSIDQRLAERRAELDEEFRLRNLRFPHLTCVEYR